MEVGRLTQVRTRVVPQRSKLPLNGNIHIHIHIHAVHAVPAHLAQAQEALGDDDAQLNQETPK